jgi:hypothetical protein
MKNGVKINGVKIISLLFITLLTTLALAGCGGSDIPGANIRTKVNPAKNISVKGFTESIADGNIKRYSFDNKTILILPVKLTYKNLKSRYAPSWDYYKLCKVYNGKYETYENNGTHEKPVKINSSLSGFLNLVFYKNIPGKYKTLNKNFTYNNSLQYITACRKNSNNLFIVVVINYFANTKAMADLLAVIY